MKVEKNLKKSLNVFCEKQNYKRVKVKSAQSGITYSEPSTFLTVLRSPMNEFYSNTHGSGLFYWSNPINFINN